MIDKEYNQKVWSKIFDNIFIEGNNLLIQGSGGTGKSYWLKKIKDELFNREINFEICSTTGSSSLDLKGKTIHSFAALGICDKSAVEITNKLKPWHPVSKHIKKCEFLILDEISMLGSKTLELLNNVLKIVRSTDLPMGGLQIVFCGDFLQLQPINDKYAFESEVWSQLNLKTIRLNKPFRFTDQRYYEMLERCRMGFLLDEDKELLLQRKISQKALEAKNLTIQPTFIFSHKIDCDQINYEKLSKLEGQLYVYNSIDTFVSKTKTFHEYSQQIIEKQMDRLIPKIIPLKKGCQVMLTINMLELGLVNGSRGVITKCEDSSIDVLFKNLPHSITIGKKEFSTETVTNCMTRLQLPIIIAYSMSINKTQGLTLDTIYVNLAKCFTSGQAYVALSRTKNFESLYIEEIDFEKIKAESKALIFENLQEKNI